MSDAPRTSQQTELADTQMDASGAGSSWVESTELARGASVGRYLVLDILGAGGMGVVYAAYDPELDRRVALKLVRYGGEGFENTAGRARVMREAQGIARLSHPNVIAVHDVGTIGDVVFIAMELVDGATVAHWLASGVRTVPQILDVFAQAGRGLVAAHAAGLVHRDFKPDNVLVDRGGRARVVDFGLVREVGGMDTQPDLAPLRRSEPALATPLTMVGTIMGTPFYMAPEQMLDQPTDARSDQYSFCSSLFEALAGHVPYRGASLEEIRSQIVLGPVPELGSGVGARKVPAHVRAAVRRGMTVDPAGRFPSMAALLDELSRDPGARRRRWLAAGGIAVALAAAATIPLLLSRGSSGTAAPVVSCTGAPEEIAKAWNPERRAALEAVFFATKAPYAAGSFASVSRQFDRYAAAWSASHTDSCRATHVQHVQSVEMLDLRTSCLRRRQTELAAVVDQLLEATPRAIMKAHGFAAALTPVADCNDLAALQAPMKLPTNPTLRSEIAAARDALARSTALFHTGKFKDAIPQVETLVERARELAYPPLEAEASVLLGRMLGRTGKEAAARAALVDGIAVALASHHDAEAWRASTMLVQVAADATQLDDAAEWVKLADSMLKRLGDPPLRRAMWHHVHGYLLSTTGKFAAAIAQHEAALAIREREAPGSQELARTLNSLAYVYDEVGRYAEARAVGERSLALQEGELGKVHPEVATVLNNLGNVASDEGDRAKATDYYRRSLAIREQTVPAGDDPLLLANALNNLGIVAMELERYDEALAYHERSRGIREAVQPEGPDLAMSYVNLGDVRHAQQRYPEALVLYRKSLAVAETLGKDHPYVGDALVGIGDTSRRLKALGQAVPALERALAIRTVESRPIERATAEAALAYALWERGGRGDRTRARELATKARQGFVSSRAATKQLAELDAWLRDHAK